MDSSSIKKLFSTFFLPLGQQTKYLGYWSNKTFKDIILSFGKPWHFSSLYELLQTKQQTNKPIIIITSYNCDLWGVPFLTAMKNRTGGKYEQEKIWIMTDFLRSKTNFTPEPFFFEPGQMSLLQLVTEKIKNIEKFEESSISARCLKTLDGILHRVILCM